MSLRPVFTDRGSYVYMYMYIYYNSENEGADQQHGYRWAAGLHLFLARLHEVQKCFCSHPGRTRSRSTLLKFSRSLYLDNQLSESIHT